MRLLGHEIPLQPGEKEEGPMRFCRPYQAAGCPHLRELGCERAGFCEHNPVEPWICPRGAHLLHLCMRCGLAHGALAYRKCEG